LFNNNGDDTMNLTPYEQLLNSIQDNNSATMPGQLTGAEYENLVNRTTDLSVTYNSLADTTTVAKS